MSKGFSIIALERSWISTRGLQCIVHRNVGTLLEHFLMETTRHVHMRMLRTPPYFDCPFPMQSIHVRRKGADSKCKASSTYLLFNRKRFTHPFARWVFAAEVAPDFVVYTGKHSQHLKLVPTGNYTQRLCSARAYWYRRISCHVIFLELCKGQRSTQAACS